MVEITHCQKTAKHFLKQIRAARPGHRCAFALGHMGGSVPVVFVARGKPAGAETKLKVTKFEPKDEPKSAAGGKTTLAASGLLLLENGGTLVLQCRRKPPDSAVRDLRRYFAQLFHLPPPWKQVVIRRLRDEDEGDGDGEQVKTDPDENDDATVVTGESASLEDQIQDEWSETASDAAPQSDQPGEPDGVEDASMQAPAPAPEAQARAPEAANKMDPAVIEANAQRLTQQTLDMVKLLRIDSGKTGAELQAFFAGLLERIPVERLMLALASASTVRDLTASADQIDDAPIAPDDAGIAQVADALLAMGMNLARQRGVLVAGEAGDRARIESMVRARWGAAPDLPAGKLIPAMIDLLGKSFAAADDKRLCGLLGLSPRPVPAPAAGIPDAAQAVWQNARGVAIADLGRLRRAVADSGDPEAAQAVAEIDGLVASLPAALDGPAGVAAVEHFLEAEPIVTDVEGQNGFGIALSIREPLLNALAAVKTAA